MAAPKGNKFWEARSKSGRNPIFSGPDELMESCIEYFEWVEANPLMELKAVQFQGEFVSTELPKMRAMTVGGLCIFLDIDQTTWENYRAKEDFFRVTKKVDEIIRNQKFTGAAADLLNPVIIARDLGLSDKKELSGDPDKPLVVIGAEMPADQATSLYKTLIDGL